MYRWYSPVTRRGSCGDRKEVTSVRPFIPVLAACALIANTQPGARAAALAITHVTVVDTGRAPQPNAIVIVEDGRIVCVGSTQDCRIPAHARRIDGHGRWLIPGLFDCARAPQ
jgi:hypothetical protein